MKIIKSRLHIGEGVVEVAILRSEMLRAYMLLDMLTEDVVGEVYFNDSAMHQRLCIQISEEATYIPETGCVMITNNHVACLKRFLSQCYLNPYDMKWLHEDIEVGISQGKDGYCMSFLKMLIIENTISSIYCAFKNSLK